MTRFRSAHLSEAEKISELVNSAYRGESSRSGWTTEADLLDGQRTDAEKIGEMIATIGATVEVAIQNDEIIGCVYMVREPESSLYFGMLVVKPGLQAKGLGKEILDRIEKIAKRGKCKKIRMHVIHLRSELISFYERRGFRATGKADSFPASDPRFGIPKIDGLKLQEFEKILD